MKIKSGMNLSTEDFFYDLFDGGYISPKKVLVDKEDAEKVYAAMNVLIEFRDSLEGEYPDFFR